jgi:hypothetical protein
MRQTNLGMAHVIHTLAPVYNLLHFLPSKHLQAPPMGEEMFDKFIQDA